MNKRRLLEELRQLHRKYASVEKQPDTEAFKDWKAQTSAALGAYDENSAEQFLDGFRGPLTVEDSLEEIRSVVANLEQELKDEQSTGEPETVRLEILRSLKAASGVQFPPQFVPPIAIRLGLSDDEIWNQLQILDHRGHITIEDQWRVLRITGSGLELLERQENQRAAESDSTTKSASTPAPPTTAPSPHEATMRQRLENNMVWVALACVVAGFLASWPVTNSIYSARLEESASTIRRLAAETATKNERIQDLESRLAVCLGR